MKYKTVKAATPKLPISTLVRLMDDCLPPEIEDERDMQKLIDKLWPALVCELEVEVVTCKSCGEQHIDGDGEAEFITWHGKCAQCSVGEGR